MALAPGPRRNEALEDLRDLARGIYPPLLADKGLASALEAQARKSPMPVSVEADGIARYPQDVESAVYFSCLEALNNVAKYAEAVSVTIVLAQRNGSLDVRRDRRRARVRPRRQRRTARGSRGCRTGSMRWEDRCA